jgi:hypothetical protein
MASNSDRVRSTFALISSQLRAGEPLSAAAGELHAILADAPRAIWPRLATAFNEDQIESKLWLIEHLAQTVELSEHRVVVLGAWYGVLAILMEQVLPRPPAAVVCVDLDEGACLFATRILSTLRSRPEVRCADMLELDHAALAAERPTVFVNTSCEHLSDFDGWRARVPAGSWLVLQSNDHVGCSEHVNCVPDVESFARQARLSETHYRGTLLLAKFRRFMLIGRA